MYEMTVIISNLYLEVWWRLGCYKKMTEVEDVS